MLVMGISNILKEVINCLISYLNSVALYKGNEVEGFGFSKTKVQKEKFLKKLLVLPVKNQVLLPNSVVKFSPRIF